MTILILKLTELQEECWTIYAYENEPQVKFEKQCGPIYKQIMNFSLRTIILLDAEPQCCSHDIKFELWSRRKKNKRYYLQIAKKVKREMNGPKGRIPNLHISRSTEAITSHILQIDRFHSAK
ncbi:hypothetical protein H5410_052473, partial [Solanum commersonii]